MMTSMFTPQPTALKRLSEFRIAYGRAISVASGAETAEDRDAVYRFERELYQLIDAFRAEAVAPFQKAMSDAMAFQRPRGMVLVDKATLDNLPPIADVELWRGQHHGVWYRVIINNGYRPQLQVSFNASLGEDHEVWQLDVIL